MNSLDRHLRASCCIADLLKRQSAIGREAGEAVYAALLDWVLKTLRRSHFEISLLGIVAMDTDFASAAIIELAVKFRGRKGFTISGVQDQAIIDVLDTAARERGAGLILRDGGLLRLIGIEPSERHRALFEFAMTRTSFHGRDYLEAERGIKLPAANKRIRTLLQQGLLVRRRQSGRGGPSKYYYAAIG